VVTSGHVTEMAIKPFDPHQIRFRLGLPPDNAWELTVLPRPLAVFKGIREGKKGI